MILALEAITRLPSSGPGAEAAAGLLGTLLTVEVQNPRKFLKILNKKMQCPSEPVVLTLRGDLLLLANPRDP